LPRRRTRIRPGYHKPAASTRRRPQHPIRLDAHRGVSVSVGSGLPRDMPDVTLTVRLPFGL
jgi:hypothetical protein